MYIVSISLGVSKNESDRIDITIPFDHSIDKPCSQIDLNFIHVTEKWDPILWCIDLTNARHFGRYLTEKVCMVSHGNYFLSDLHWSGHHILAAHRKSIKAYQIQREENGKTDVYVINCTRILLYESLIDSYYKEIL